MVIIIPVSEVKGLESTVVTLDKVKKWALVDLTSDSIEPTFHDDWQDTGADFIEHIILDNHDEDAIDFINEGLFCLVRREEKQIDELIAAFRFRELDELAF
jgi:hypothetical protein